MPAEPPCDPITAYLLGLFRNITRGRRFVATMGGVFPLPIGAREISDWLESHPSALPREDIDEVVFALDQVCLAHDEE